MTNSFCGIALLGILAAVTLPGSSGFIAMDVFFTIPIAPILSSVFPGCSGSSLHFQQHKVNPSPFNANGASRCEKSVRARSNARFGRVDSSLKCNFEGSQKTVFPAKNKRGERACQCARAQIIHHNKSMQIMFESKKGTALPPLSYIPRIVVTPRHEDNYNGNKCASEIDAAKAVLNRWTRDLLNQNGANLMYLPSEGQTLSVNGLKGCGRRWSMARGRGVRIRPWKPYKNITRPW